MNYYNPNYMGGYQYNYPNQYVPQSVQPQQFISQPLPPQSQQPQSLNGKIVDSEDVVKATEVPIGGYGIFPKADLSEIYIKSWNNNGTTSIITFKPIVPEPQANQPNVSEINNILLQKIEGLENKIDSLLQPAPTKEIKKVEVTKNGF
jgi:hypothetical protein